MENAGQLLDEVNKHQNDNSESSNNKIANSLGDVMWYVAGFADIFQLNLNKIASENAEKARSLYPDENNKTPTRLFDEKESDLEQIPRNFAVDIVKQDEGTSVIFINSVRIGDPLEDNSYDEDGYRFHDAIHLAFLAILGWSPVMRALLKRKRKSDRKLDSVEDDARAQVVDEMIAKLCHSYAKNIDPIKLLIPSSTDHDRCAHSRCPVDMIFDG